MTSLFCFGLGYSAESLSRRLAAAGWRIAGTSTSAVGVARIAALGYRGFLFDGTSRVDAVAEAVREATHVLVSAAPGDRGDPALAMHRADLASAPILQWVGYLSTIGVYGDHDGSWIDEDEPPNPNSDRTVRRVEAEQAWLDLGRETGRRVEVFRLAGIYGPGRSAIDTVKDGTARRIVKPGQVFNRIHVEDIAGVVQAAIGRPGGAPIYNVTDDEPAPPQDVIAYAAELLGLPVPPAIPFEIAGLSPMAVSFYSANKRVRNARIKTRLGVKLLYPTYREGLRAIAVR